MQAHTYGRTGAVEYTEDTGLYRSSIQKYTGRAEKTGGLKYTDSDRNAPSCRSLHTYGVYIWHPAIFLALQVPITKQCYIFGNMYK